MNVLVDSHALVWAATGDPRLSARARSTFAKESLFLSCVTHWELAMKAQRRRLPIAASVQQLIAEQARQHGLEMMGVTFDHTAEFERLPAHHGDPFDRMLVAQARVEGLVLLSADAIFRRYDVEVVW